MSDHAGVLGVITETNVPVPMRDGVILRANVFRPDGPGHYPALLERTPYGKGEGGFERYVRAGYVVVTQDTRGRYASEGTYVPFTVEHTGDAEDGYDGVEWLARQLYCNGKVGTMGASYNAWMQWMLARLRPPHLVAMCARSIPRELTGVDWPGAFKPARRVFWWMTTIAPDIRKRQGLPGVHSKEEARRIWDEIEHSRWLGLLPWMRLPRYLPPGLAEYVEDWLHHPARRPWRFAESYAEIEVPNLDISGWYDHCGDTMHHLAGMQVHAKTVVARTQTKLVIGPWSHATVGKRQVGAVDFGPQAQLDLVDTMIHWFDYWLKGLENGVDQEPAVRYFVMGSRRWKHTDTWPPENMAPQVLYLSNGGVDASSPDGAGLLQQACPGEEPADTYAYDPNDPVPTLWSRALFSEPPDRRRLEYRHDILYYRTPPLTRAIEIVGYPEVALYAASSAPDTDFFARLVDEAPGGPALEVAYGMVRARHRHSLEREDLLTPGEITEFRIKMGATACRFLAGHRVRIEITSSDFPNHDRNHNTGRNDLADTILEIAAQHVHHSSQFPSRLILPVSQEA